MASIVNTPPLEWYFQVRNKVPTGQYVQPQNTKFDITVYAKGSFLFTIHDLNAITLGDTIQEGEQCVFAQFMESEGVQQFQSTEYILPVLSNPKRIHTILFCLWQTEGRVPETKHTVEYLKERYRLARVGTFVTAYDASTSALYKEIGRHEPVLGHRIVKPVQQRSVFRLPTRMELKAPLAKDPVHSVDLYTAKVMEVRDREGIVVERPRKTVGRYHNA
jgi:archaellum component FlaF (FlaF/FlaG flagellin family)